MHHSLFLASALTLASRCGLVAARAADLGLRNVVNPIDKRLVCVGDSFNTVFTEVGMGDPDSPVQADITSFCRSFIDIPDRTTFIDTVTPTETFFPATVTVGITTQTVTSATGTITVTETRTDFALKRRDAAPEPPVEAPVKRNPVPEKMILKARQTAKTLDVAALAFALSSACSCKMIPPKTVYATTTVNTRTRTIGATDFQYRTVNSTVAGGIATTTVTLDLTSTIRPTNFTETTEIPSTSTEPPTSVSTSTSNSTMTNDGTSTESETSAGPSTYNSTVSTPYPTGTGNTNYSTISSNRTITSRSSRPYPTDPSSGWPKPTKNQTSCLPCATGYNNNTLTVTGYTTLTETSTLPRLTTTTTTTTTEYEVETFTQPASTETEFETETLPAETRTVDGETTTVTAAGVTTTETIAETTITESASMADPVTVTTTVTVTPTSTMMRRPGHRNGRWNRWG